MKDLFFFPLALCHSLLNLFLLHPQYLSQGEVCFSGTCENAAGGPTLTQEIGTQEFVEGEMVLEDFSGYFYSEDKLVYSITGLPYQSGLDLNVNTGVLHGRSNVHDRLASPILARITVKSAWPTFPLVSAVVCSSITRVGNERRVARRWREFH